MLLLKRFFGRICHPFLNTINIQKKFVFCYVYKKTPCIQGTVIITYHLTVLYQLIE